MQFALLVFGDGNMSIVTRQQVEQQEQYLQSFHKSNTQSTRPLVHTEKQWKKEKSIELENKSQEKHVTWEIKSKQLVRQTPVAVIETKAKPEDKSGQSQSQEVDIIQVVNGLEGDSNECSEQKDYQIYQNGKVNDFFKNELLEKPKNVSDICLVNDHFILVKMSQDMKQDQEDSDSNQPLALAARRKEFRMLRDDNVKRSLESTKSNKKLCRYLRIKRNRITRITPMHEEPEDVSDTKGESFKTQSKFDCLKMQFCLQGNEQEVETYETNTRIRKGTLKDKFRDFISNEPKNSREVLENVKCDELHKPSDIQTISGSLLKSSPHHQVTLHNYGSIMDSKGNSNVLKINFTPRHKSSRFESFDWLLRPFCGKYRKPKPIQAVVYKTYFVKWTKPPDTLSHGYGVRPSKSTEIKVSVLRRCRSAIF